MTDLIRNRTIALIDKTDSGGPAAFGKEELLQALAEREIRPEPIGHWSSGGDAGCLLIGTTADRQVRFLLEQQGVAYVQKPEGVIYQWCTAGAYTVLLVAGTDERGLMYALLELAERLRMEGADALERVADAIEYPEHRVRGLDRYIMGPHDDDWFYSDEFWQYYCRRLAYGRYNRFVFITGWDTSHFSPPYPFFVDVPGFDGITVPGFTAEDRSRNLRQLQRIGELCHRHGLDFFFGIWQQKPWTGSQEVLLHGIPEDELEFSEYCCAGLQALIEQCPPIDGLQFRVNMESGIGKFKDTNNDFWNMCIDAVAGAKRKVQLDLRAKGATNEMIQHAVETGLDVTVPTKFWCEHLGLPYHPTVLRHEELADIDNPNSSRRYSYGDMLRKPRWYDVIYRLWNYGSASIFLWGDADYAARFAQSCRLGDSAGFEVSAPLGLKGGHATVQKQMDPWTLFREPEPGQRWEDERYWLWYKLFGRLGYASGTAPAVWMREFAWRFGAEAAPEIERLYRLSGKILPLITAFHMPVHPSLCYWPELSTGGALFAENNHTKDFNYNSKVEKNITYTVTEPSDPGLFARISEYVEQAAAGEAPAKYSPLQVRGWLRHLSAEIGVAVDRVERLPGMAEHVEFLSSRHDFLMLAHLAEYHARRIVASIEFHRHSLTGDSAYLQHCLAWMREARDSWEELVRLGGKYADNLVFNAGAGSGLGRSGHWRDRLAELDSDIRQLEELIAGGAPAAGGPASADAAPAQAAAAESRTALDFERPPEWVRSHRFTAHLPSEAPAGRDLAVTLRLEEAERFAAPVLLHYRHADQTAGEFRTAPMSAGADGFAGIIPGEYITPEWDLLVYFSTRDENGDPVLLPGIFHPDHPFPYFAASVRG